MPETLRHIALIARREYLQRVRTKSFLITTFLTPAIMAGFMFLPGFFMTMKTGGQKNLVIVSDDSQLAQSFANQLNKGPEKKYELRTDPNTSTAERNELDAEVAGKDIDGYVLLTKDALAKGKVEFHARSTGDFMESDELRHAATFAAIQQRLESSGIHAVNAEALMSSVEIEPIQVGRGKSNADALFLAAMLLVLVLYMTVVIHGVAVMRSVLEEKTSRVMEVLLSAVTPKELMAGKISGVGAVGLTQIGIWSLIGLFLAFFGGAAATAAQGLHFSAMMIVFFVIFYLLGFLLYSSLSAAMGAMVNSEEEAQQLQFFVVLPIILALMMIGVIFRDPSSIISITLSMIPFFAPILMYLRIVVEQPPVWQLALCVAILIATIYGFLSICARIYRVGILMYGKRPTLPEILKWVRYA
jgi:ABC-2 type transport system permease protein